MLPMRVTPAGVPLRRLDDMLNEKSFSMELFLHNNMHASSLLTCIPGPRLHMGKGPACLPVTLPVMLPQPHQVQPTAERVEESSLFLLEGRRDGRNAAGQPPAGAKHQQKACLDIDCWPPSGLVEVE